MMLTTALMWSVGIVFTLRENLWLTVAGMAVFVAVMPVSEAAEHTVLQRVVPYPQQGRVFGFIQAVEVAASPVSAFLVGPLAELWLIPYLDSVEGRARWGWLLGEGHARGIAAVFILASTVGLVMTLVALRSRPYRRMSDAYAAAAPPAESRQDAAGSGFAVGPLNHPPGLVG